MISLRILLSSALLAGTAATTVLFLNPQSQAAKTPPPQPEPSTPPGAAYSSTVAPEMRRAFFGEMHLHTSLSFDAWTAGTKLMPEQAYAFGRGDTIMVPAIQVQRQQGGSASAEVPVRRAWPLDFMAVTDHSENLGILRQLDDPTSEFAQTPIGKRFLEKPGQIVGQLFAARFGVIPPLPAAVTDPVVMGRAWEENIRATNLANRPGRFTTFIGYEWTGMGKGGGNLHRNVIFNSNNAPPPFTTDQSQRPEDLWTYLEQTRTNGRDVIAIPHNANASGGLMYDWNASDSRPIDEAYAQRRILNEPLSEIAQIKGQSETLPALSPNDEFANFEIFDRLLGGGKSQPNGSYIRQAYGRGLVIQAKVGANPYKFGIVGGSDIHNGLSTSNENATAGGHNGGMDPETMMPRGDDARRAIGLPTSTASETGVSEAEIHGAAPSSKPNQRVGDQPFILGSGALTGVWAEENTRNAIFAALKRKETFATSGTRIRVRMFGGWNLVPNLMSRRDWVKYCYAKGTPMGGDLPPRSLQDGAPAFALQAMKDPDGANLDRIQIVKVWRSGDGFEEKVFDVVWSNGRRIDLATGQVAPVGNTVDLKTGVYTNSIGASMLSTVWRDPEFNPETPAVYYARVLEIPTPRWSTLLAVKNQLPLTTLAAATIQERAWSSPIWFTPK